MMYRKLKIESVVSNLRIVENAIDELSAEIGIKQDCYGKIMVSVMEAVNNGILHGNKSVPEKFVEVVFTLQKEKLVVSVEDEGTGFNPKGIPDPTSPENIENISGRGVFLMSKLADSIDFNEKGNKVTMSFKDIRT